MKGDVEKRWWYKATIHYLLPTDVPSWLHPLLRILPVNTSNKINNPVTLF
jgi:hypothetical protein